MFVNITPVSSRSNTQKTVTLPVTEVEGAACFMVAHDMLYVYRLLQSLGLEMELPMILDVDNKGALDLANNWSMGGRTRHVDIRNNFMRELKDMGLIQCRYVPGPENNADIFTKNIKMVIFETHIPKFVGVDEFMREWADIQSLDTSK